MPQVAAGAVVAGLAKGALTYWGGATFAASVIAGLKFGAATPVLGRLAVVGRAKAGPRHHD
jgi:hypothetical protein